MLQQLVEPVERVLAPGFRVLRRHLCGAEGNGLEGKSQLRCKRHRACDKDLKERLTSYVKPHRLAAFTTTTSTMMATSSTAPAWSTPTAASTPTSPMTLATESYGELHVKQRGGRRHPASQHDSRIYLERPRSSISKVSELKACFIATWSSEGSAGTDSQPSPRS